MVAEDFDTARHAATLVKVDYEAEAPSVDLTKVGDFAYDPPMKRNGIKPPPKPWGDADAVFDTAAVKVREQYTLATEHHNPMEPHASTVIVEEDGTYTVYDKIQGVSNSQGYLANVFGLKKDEVRV